MKLENALYQQIATIRIYSLIVVLTQFHWSFKRVTNFT